MIVKYKWILFKHVYRMRSLIVFRAFILRGCFEQKNFTFFYVQLTPQK